MRKRGKRANGDGHRDGGPGLCEDLEREFELEQEVRYDPRVGDLRRSQAAVNMREFIVIAKSQGCQWAGRASTSRARRLDGRR